LPTDVPSHATQIFQSLSEGFVHTPLEIILFFAIVLLLILAVSGFAIALGVAARRRVAERAHQVFQRKVARLSLNAEEAALLQRLAGYRGRAEPQYMVLQSRPVFDACAQRMRRAAEGSEAVPEPVLNSLRLKIGFRLRRPDETPVSTSELPEGSTLVLAAGPSRRLRGRIGAQGPNGMVVRLDPSQAPLPTRATLEVQFHNRAGMFSFRSRVIEAGAGMVRLQHSARIRRHQRRQYYRREERMTVAIIPFGKGAVPVRTRILDLGGGGASLENAGGTMGKGNLVRVFLSPWIGKLAVNARVLRLSRNGAVIHVRFESISEADRRRIIRFLFHQASQAGAKDRPA
jgi:hypothetical protein